MLELRIPTDSHSNRLTSDDTEHNLSVYTEHNLSGGVGYFLNECGFSVKSSLQLISSKFCGNETIRRYLCTRDLDAANLRPALEQGCRKKTPGANK